MKKLLFGLIAIVMFGFAGNAQTKSTTNAIGKPKSTPKVVGWFSAGVYGCWGWDFCDGGAPWDKVTIPGKTTQTMNEDNTMSFSIPLSYMNEENVRFYSDKNTFVLKNDSRLEIGEYKLFGLNPETVYSAGTYPLVNDGRSISFTVKFN
jgi:hypothetical protein